MKKVKFLMMVMLVAAVATSVSAQKKVDPTGTWAYKASEAPYEYSAGDIVITKEGKEYKVEIVLGEYYKVKGSNVKYEKNEISFTVYIESESVHIKGTVDKENIKGSASYTDGTIPITATKKE
jgi:carbonic anhydrase